MNNQKKNIENEKRNANNLNGGTNSSRLFLRSFTLDSVFPDWDEYGFFRKSGISQSQVSRGRYHCDLLTARERNLLCVVFLFWFFLFTDLFDRKPFLE